MRRVTVRRGLPPVEEVVVEVDAATAEEAAAELAETPDQDYEELLRLAESNLR